MYIMLCTENVCDDIDTETCEQCIVFLISFEIVYVKACRLMHAVLSHLGFHSLLFTCVKQEGMR
jgi:hypothetical protein